MADRDLEWLVSHIPEQDLLGINDSRVNDLQSVIDTVAIDELPMTVGVFGNWGCGKTSFLAYLALRLKDKKAVVYFNAWKYAGFLEIVPSLIYKILSSMPETNESKRDMTYRLMLSLGRKYGSQLGEWIAKYTCINPVEIVKDISDFQAELSEPYKTRERLVSDYYTQIDRAQDMLEKILAGQTDPIIVLIDELDRCDPGEAFEVVKQLRIFFSMRRLPLIFVLSANPEPIGLAIKHQYGLDSGVSDYESRRILEKFVDSYIDMSDPLPLGEYMLHLWQNGTGNTRSFPLVHHVDRRQSRTKYHLDTVKNSNIFSAITTGNRLYSNLRVLEKSLAYVKKYKKDTSPNLWCLWHLEILRQVQMDLLADVRALASEIGMIAATAHVQLVGDLANIGVLDSSNGVLKNKVKFKSDKGNTAFSVYRSWFWDIAKARGDNLAEDKTSEGIERYEILKKWLRDHHLITFLVSMSAQTGADTAGLFKHVTNLSENQWLDDWRLIGTFNHFSWLLANY